MRVAVIAEKQTISEEFMSAINEVYSPSRPIGPMIVYTIPYVHLNASFSYPRGLKWKDYPFVGEPSYKPYDLWSYLPPRCGIPPNSEFLYEIPEAYRFAFGLDLPREEVDGIVANYFREADVIVAAMDWEPSSVLSVRRVLDHFFPEGVPMEKVVYPTLAEWNPKGIARAISEAIPYAEIEARFLPYAKALRRFDYSYGVNAFGILETTMMMAGARRRYAPSKFAIQFLYALRKHGPMTEGRAMQMMEDWKGSGRYVSQGYSWTEFGSPASRGPIIEQLMEHRLVGRTGSDRKRVPELFVSELGECFLQCLHPDCEDPDLPFRLHQWCSLPVAESYPKIDRYLRTWFGKQKRFLSSLDDERSKSGHMRFILGLTSMDFGTITDNANTKIILRGSSAGSAVPFRNPVSEEDAEDDIPC